MVPWLGMHIFIVKIQYMYYNWIHVKFNVLQSWRSTNIMCFMLWVKHAIIESMNCLKSITLYQHLGQLHAQLHRSEVSAYEDKSHCLQMQPHRLSNEAFGREHHNPSNETLTSYALSALWKCDNLSNLNLQDWVHNPTTSSYSILLSYESQYFTETFTNHMLQLSL
jgi:hypothetical protein